MAGRRISYGRATEQDLVAAARDGDRRAFDELMVRHKDTIYRVCYQVLGNREDALDASQVTMVNAWRAVGSFREQASVRTWVYRIATNAALREAQRRSRRGLPVEDLPEPRAELRPSGPAEQVTDALALSWALSRLRPEFRAALVLRELGGLSYEEIAETLDVKLNTVRTRIARGRRGLADLLTEAGAGGAA